MAALSGKVINGIIGIIFIIIAIVIILVAYHKNKLIKEMNDKNYWKTGKNIGEIMISDMENKTSGNIIGKDDSYVKYTNSENQYKPIIVYKYKVNGKEYQNNKINPDGVTWGSKTKTLLIKNKYKVNKKVDVIYNISNPNDSYLEKGTGTNMIIVYIISAFIALLGILAMFGVFGQFKINTH